MVKSGGTALVVGGSMAGLFAGLLLRQSGWHVTICERSLSSLNGRGAGIVTHPQLVTVLREAGVPPGETLGVDIARRRVYGRDGNVLEELDFPQLTTSWDLLLRLLRRGVPDADYRLTMNATRIDLDHDAATVGFADGSFAKADLVVLADGLRSALRKELFPEVSLAYAGYVGWRGLVDEASLSPSARDALFDCFAFGIPTGEQFLCYPVAGPGDDVRTGHRRLNFVWYRPADVYTLERLLTDTNAAHHKNGIPPLLIAEPVISEMRQAARDNLAPAFAEAVERADLPFFQPIYDLDVPQMYSGRAAIIGDAAFVARPHVGAGVTKAAMDASALRRALDSYAAVPDALAAFNEARRPVNQRIADRGRALGASIGGQVNASDPPPAMASLHSIMRDTASLAFLGTPN